MRWLWYALTIAATIGLAIWAYGQDHQTQLVHDELRDLRREISQLNESISVHRAEWAYLNRPERLIRLAELNLQTLRLGPIEGHQFRRITDIPLNMDFAATPPAAQQGISPQTTGSP